MKLGLWSKIIHIVQAMLQFCLLPITLLFRYYDNAVDFVFDQ